MTTTTTTAATAAAPPPADSAGAAPPVAEAVPQATGLAEVPEGGSWEQPGEATSRSGDGTARSEHWRNARGAHGDHFDGDRVAGHKIVLQIGDRKVEVSELSLDLRDPVRYAYVKPRNWAQLNGRFAANRTSILRGPAGHGKDATAIRLLSAEASTIFTLDPRIDITQLAPSIAAQADRFVGTTGGVGFLLCQPDGAAQLGGYTFQALERALTAANARLVITLPPTVTTVDDDLKRYVLDLDDERVDRGKIVARHLSWRCNDEDASRLLASEVVQELIAELDESDQSCGAAADLAWVISIERDDEGMINAARVRERRRRQNDEAFDRWFDGLRDAEERSFAIALAVLNGLSFEEVADAGRRLRRRLETSGHLVLSVGAQSRQELRVARRDLLQAPVARLLDRLRAYQRDEHGRYSYGTVPVRTVQYKDPDYALKVIERMWRGYQIQPTLVDWLEELVNGPSEPVRFFAASTFGVLARYSFDYLLSRLHSLAGSRNPRRREAAAYALRQCAEDPAFAPAVNLVVSNWFAAGQAPLLQATAARAYGVGVGGMDTAAVIDRIGRLATINDFRIAAAIGDALADLILDDPERVAPLVCEALVTWFDDGLRARPGQLAFIILATSLLTWDPTPDGGDGAPWPSLLLLTRTVAPLRRPLVELWSRVIRQSVLYKQAHAALTLWAGLAEAHPTQLDALVRLVRAVAVDGRRTVDILSRLVEEWIAPENLTPLPRAHEAVTAELARIRERS